jgi:hypothetical protein
VNGRLSDEKENVWLLPAVVVTLATALLSAAASVAPPDVELRLLGRTFPGEAPWSVLILMRNGDDSPRAAARVGQILTQGISKD